MTENRKNKIDEALVKRFVNDDMQAFDTIYSIFNQKLQNFIFSLIKTESDTEDLVHEVFVKVWENRKKLKNFNSFDSYLFSIAYNATISTLRNKAKTLEYIEYVKSVQIDVDEQTLNESIQEEDISEKLNQLIEKMPPRQKEVFSLKHYKNLTYNEIAEKLNISVNTVENHMVKSHKFLKDNLGKSYLPVLLFINLFL